MTIRSSRDTVRNPVLALPSALRIAALPSAQRAQLAVLLREMSADARQRAQKCWRQNKAPMAVYWKAVGAYATHLHRVIRPESPPNRKRREEAHMAKTSWIIDWHIQGSIEIEADSLDKAQEVFDECFENPRFFDPIRDGELSNDPPYRKSFGKRPGGRHEDQA